MRSGLARPNEAQIAAAGRYSGDVVAWVVKTGEYSDERQSGYAFHCYLDSGWVALIGRYGAVIQEHIAA
jgi:hypothetical protein